MLFRLSLNQSEWNVSQRNFRLTNSVNIKPSNSTSKNKNTVTHMRQFHWISWHVWRFFCECTKKQEDACSAGSQILSQVYVRWLRHKSSQTMSSFMFGRVFCSQALRFSNKTTASAGIGNWYFCYSKKATQQNTQLISGCVRRLKAEKI